MKADRKTENVVTDVLEGVLAAYRARDLDKVMGFYADDPDMTAIGTNLDQFLVGPERIREAYQEDFDAFDRFDLKMAACRISAEGNVAWASARCAAAFEVDGESIRSEARLTVVLLNRGDRWRIIQFHLSFPADQLGTEGAAPRL